MTQHHPLHEHRTRRQAVRTAIAPAHDARAWVRFLVIAMLLLATVPFAGTARAQLPDLPLPIGDDPSEDPSEEPTEDPTEEEGGVPALPVDPTGGGDTAGPATAYFTAPTSFLVPGTVFDDTVQCVVIPDTCSPEAEELLGPVREGLLTVAGGLDAGTEGAPQPVPPGALPVGLVNGNQRYSLAVDVGPPPVGEGKTVGSYTIAFQMSDASFSIQSPAFREFVTVAVSQAGTGSPEDFQPLFDSIVAGETDLFTEDFPGLEACIAAEPWTPGPNQPLEAEPSVGDGFACSDAAYPDDDGVVTFDLTFAAQEYFNPEPFFPVDWSNGLLIRPLAAQNLAYGDADYTTNYYAYLEDITANPPQVSYDEVDAPAPVPTIPPNDSSGGSSGSGSSSGGSGGSSGSSGGRGSSSGSGSSGSSSGGSTSRPSSPASSTTATTTTIAPPGDLGGSDIADVEAVAEAEPFTDDFAPVNETATSFPIAWVLLPMMLGGAFWYGRVLDTSPVVQQVVRSGAMTRLLRQRGFNV